MTYELRVSEAYQADDVHSFDSIELAVAYIRERRLFLDDCSLYPTPVEVNLYDVMNPKTERRGGLALSLSKEER